MDRDEAGGSLNRYKKDSFYWYQEVIATDGATIDYINRKNPNSAPQNRGVEVGFLHLCLILTIHDFCPKRH